MYKILCGLGIVLLMGFQAEAQTRGQAKKKATVRARPAATTAHPENAPVAADWKKYSGKTVYFPDYYTFYDYKRDGYIYMKDSLWHVSNDRPVFMRSSDMGTMRVQVLQDESDQMPEDKFDQYMKMYPPQNPMPSQPVPILTVTR